MMAESTLKSAVSRPMAVSPPRDEMLRGRRTYHGILLGLCAVLLVVAAVMTVPDSEHVAIAGIVLPPMCGFRTLFGLDCAGCGMTRCFVAAAHGQLARAWAFHPGGLLLFGLIVAQIPYRGWQLWRLSQGREEVRHPALLWIPWLLLVLLLAQWLYRISQIAA